MNLFYLNRRSCLLGSLLILFFSLLACAQRTDNNIQQQYEQDLQTQKAIFQQTQVYWQQQLRVETESDQVDKDQNSWQDFTESQSGTWQQQTQAQTDQWQDYAEAQHSAWQEYVEGVQQKWGEFVGSTSTEWVDYTTDRKVRSFVDYEEGYAVIEALVELSEDAAHAGLQIESQWNRIHTAGLENQVEQENVLAEDVQPVFAGTVQGDDGVKRSRFQVSFRLVSDHLQRRAEIYKPLVERYCNEYQVDAGLVMAIIHTESYFNPQAHSWANAYGLMQIVPRFAGRETYKALYGRDEIPSGEFLMDPENNVRHGVYYISLLSRRYWKGIEDATNNEYTTICSYNCGPGNVQRMVFDKYGTPEVYSTDRLYELLTSYTPEETRDYLQKVTSRLKIWRDLGDIE